MKVLIVGQVCSQLSSQLQLLGATLSINHCVCPSSVVAQYSRRNEKCCVIEVSPCKVKILVRATKFFAQFVVRWQLTQLFTLGA